MLRQFQFLDQNGKDQGLNVRNRAKELVELLSDVERIRGERKKARSNRNKFGGVEGGGGLSSGMSGGGSSSRYGGFGSEDAGAGYGNYSGQVYGDGGGFGGSTGEQYGGSSQRRDKYEEYDEGDDPAHASSTSSRRAGTATTTSSTRRKKEEPKPKEPEVDLFDFGDDDVPPMTPPKPASNGKQPAAAPLDDDDFGDFISETPAPRSAGLPSIAPPQSTTSISPNTQFAAPKPVSVAQGANINEFIGFSSISPAPSSRNPLATPPSSTFSSPPLMQNTFTAAPQAQTQTPMQSMQPMQAQPPRPTGYQAAQPNYFTTIQAQATSSATTSGLGGTAPKPGLTSTSSFGPSKPASKAAANDAFGSLWSSASSGAGIKKSTTTTGPNLASMAKEKTQAGIWGANAAVGSAKPAQQQQRPPQGGSGGGLDDLLG